MNSAAFSYVFLLHMLIIFRGLNSLQLQLSCHHDFAQCAEKYTVNADQIKMQKAGNVHK